MANTKVQSEQIEDGAITAAKIADGAIVASEVADNAITTAKINADAVTGAKIADNAIDSEHYTDGSIDTAHIADDQVTQAKMANDSVGADELASSAVVTASIVDDAVTSAKLDTNIDIAGTFDVTGATTLDSTLAVAGNVGIGGAATDPQGFGTALHIEGGTNSVLYLRDTGNSNYGYLGFAGGSDNRTTLTSFGSGYLQFATNNTERVVIDAAGDMTLKTAGKRYYIPRASDGAATGSLYSPTGNEIRLSAAGSSGGYITFEPSSSSGEILRINAEGIAFNGDSAAANSLDDYEEGLFTANLVDSGGGATYTLSSSFNQLSYTKVGRLVTIHGTLVVSGVSGTANGTIQISNLPFTSANLQDQSGKSGGCGVSIYQVQKYSSGAFPATSLAEGSTTVQVVLGVVDANTYACYANTVTQLYWDFTYVAA